MDKIKIYMDTSVISYLDQQDSPEKMQDTLKFWEILKRGKYNIIMSSIVFEEINRCTTKKQNKLYEYLSEIKYNVINVDEEIKELAQKIIVNDILTDKSRDDYLHLATAMLNDCSFVVSWNFKHLVNSKTISGIRKIMLEKYYNKSIDIYSPNMLLEDNNDYEKIKN